MLTRTLSVPRTARYHLLGTPEEPWEEVWYVLHGYGQRADDFLESCGALVAPGRLVVAPEGLSRFYARGTRGEVGASWMTREAREDEIADYVGYLDALHCALRDTRPGRAKARIGVLGFSQGTATASRWCVLGKIHPSQLVLWASGFAPDLAPDAVRAKLGAAAVTLVLGDDDALVSRERGEEEAERLRALLPQAELRRYAGGHAVDAATLAEVAARGPGAETPGRSPRPPGAADDRS